MSNVQQLEDRLKALENETSDQGGARIKANDEKAAKAAKETEAKEAEK